MAHKILSRSFRLQPRGLVYLGLMVAVGAAAIIRGNNLFFIIFSTLVGLFVANVFLAITTVRNLELTRILPDHAVSHRPFQSGLKIRNRKRFIPLFAVRFEDHFTHEGQITGLKTPPLFIPICLPRRAVRSSAPVTSFQRGVSNFGPIAVTSEFPPGLVSYRVVMELPGSVLVYPREGVVTRRVISPLAARVESELFTPAGGSGDQDIAGVREYRPGDNPKWIHWKLSARIPDRTYLREFEEAVQREAVIILDTHLPNAMDSRRRSRQERAISFSAALAEELRNDNYKVRVRMASPGPTDVEIGSSDLSDLQAALAVLKPSREQTVASLMAADGADDRRIYFVLTTGDEPQDLPPPASPAVVIHASDMRQYMYYSG